MPQPTKGPRLGSGPAHQRLLLAGLATSLFEHGKIQTTEAKAKRVRPLAEKLITKAKRGDLAARREVLKVVRDKSVVHALFTDIGPRYENRPGGYTRITKLEPRKGDNAPMAVIELVEALTVAQSAVGEAERARGTQFSQGGSAQRGGASGGTAGSGSSPAAPATAAGEVDDAPTGGVAAAVTTATDSTATDSTAGADSTGAETAAADESTAPATPAEAPPGDVEVADSSVADEDAEDDASKG